MQITNLNNGIFFIVPARDSKNVRTKITELEKMRVPFIIVCGDKVNHPNVVYQKNQGKWAAINFGANFIPKNTKIVVLNDADTKIHNFQFALDKLTKNTPVIYCRVHLYNGPQVKFYKLLNPWRQHFHIFSSGELMLIRKEVLDEVLPLPPCIAEDSYILFKALELNYKAMFCTNTYVTTERTTNPKDEASYKRRTTLGIFQALKYANPPPQTKLFYVILPLCSPLLSLLGVDGRSWSKGINQGIKDYLTNQQPTKF